MGHVRVEFTIEPFVDAEPGPHVLAGWAVVEAAGLQLINGPFSAYVELDAAESSSLIGGVVQESLAAGASRVAIQVERIDG